MGGAWPTSGQQLGDVHALVAHALDVLDHVQQRGDHAEVGGDGRLQGQQRQDPLLDLEVAPVDAVVVVDDDRRELDVLVLHGLERAIERAHDEVEPSEGLGLEVARAPRGRLPLRPSGMAGVRYPNRPLT